MSRLIAISLAAMACAPPPEAPQELGALSRFLFHEFEDARATSAALRNLGVLLVDNSVTEETPVEERVWTLPPMTLRDVADLPARPERDPDGVRGLGSSFVSAWPPACHARVHVKRDQLPVEPNATAYVRRFPFEDDPACFPERRCEEVHAVSEVTRQNPLLKLDFVLHKLYRWVDVVDDDGVEQAAIVARSWSEESFPGEGGALWQSYTSDLWMPHPGGGAWRYQAHWSETEIYGLGDTSDIQLRLNRTATEEAMVATDDVLAGLCGGNP